MVLSLRNEEDGGSLRRIWRMFTPESSIFRRVLLSRVWPVTALTSWHPRCSGAVGESRPWSQCPWKAHVPRILPSVISTSDGLLMMDRVGVGRACLAAAGNKQRGGGSCARPSPTPRLCVSVFSCLPVLPAVCYWVGMESTCFVPYNNFSVWTNFVEFIVFMDNSFLKKVLSGSLMFVRSWLEYFSYLFWSSTESSDISTRCFILNPWPLDGALFAVASLCAGQSLLSLSLPGNLMWAMVC